MALIAASGISKAYSSRLLFEGVSFEIAPRDRVGLVGVNGCGKTKFVMIQGIIGAFAVRIPVSYLMSKITPVSVFKVGLATPCSTIVQIILCGIYFMMMNKKEKQA